MGQRGTRPNTLKDRLRRHTKNSEVNLDTQPQRVMQKEAARVEGMNPCPSGRFSEPDAARSRV